MTKEKSCAFYGVEISETTKKSLTQKLEQFLGMYFEWFRDKAEEFGLRTRGDVLSNFVFRHFGDNSLYYDITALTEGNIRFDISDERDRAYLTFWANRISGRLIKVFIRSENILKIHKVLNLLIKPSWVD